MRGHIRKLTSGHFEAIAYLGRHPHTEKRMQKSKTHATERGAEAWLRQQAEGREWGVNPDADRLTVGALLDQWYAATTAKGRGEKTLDGYERAVRVHLKPPLGRLRLAKLTPQVIEGFAAAAPRNADGEMRRATRMALDVLGIALRWADRRGVLPGRNPMERAELARPRTRRRPVPWDLEQVRLFLGEARRTSFYHAFYRTALMAGLRQGELCGLRTC